MNYISKSDKVTAIEFMGFNWEYFLHSPSVVDWSLSDKLKLTLKGGGSATLGLGDWLVVFADKTFEVLSSQDFYNEYESI